MPCRSTPRNGATSHFIFAVWTRPDGGRERVLVGVRAWVGGANVEVMSHAAFPVSASTLVTIPRGDRRLRRWLRSGA